MMIRIAMMTLVLTIGCGSPIQGDKTTWADQTTACSNADTRTTEILVSTQSSDQTTEITCAWDNASWISYRPTDHAADVEAWTKFPTCQDAKIVAVFDSFDSDPFELASVTCGTLPTQSTIVQADQSRLCSNADVVEISGGYVECSWANAAWDGLSDCPAGTVTKAYWQSDAYEEWQLLDVRCVAYSSITDSLQ